MDDKFLNILLKNKLKVPSSSTIISNTNLETRLTNFSDIIYSEDIYVEKIPNLNSIIFDRYYLYNSTNQTVNGYLTLLDVPTGENYNVNGTISADLLYNNCKYIIKDIWQEFINGNLYKVSITSNTNYNYIVKIENLKTNIISDTQNTVSPSYFNNLLKDSILDTNGSKGYDIKVYGYSGLSNTQIDISNKDIGNWIIHPETGIIQFLDPTAIINTNNSTINLFNTNYSSNDNALLNKYKTPFISFYRYNGFKGFKDFAKLDDIPSEIIIDYSSNITFLDSSNNIGSTLQSTSDGGLLVTVNEFSSSQFNIKGTMIADKVVSGRITLTHNTGAQISGAFLPSGNDLFYTGGNVGIGTGAPKYELDVYGNVHLSGPSKIVIQGGKDGGSGQGIFMNTDSDTNWGIYLASSGIYKSLSDGTSTSGYNFISLSMRFRSSNNIQSGFIWENSAETLLMSLKSDGSLYVSNTANLNNIQIEGVREQGGVWLNLDGGNYGALYQNGTGTFGLVTTSQIQTSSNLEWGLKIIKDGATSLSYNGNEKIITNNTGIDVKNSIQIGDHSLIIKNADTVLSLNNSSPTHATYIQMYSDGCSGYNSTNGLLFGLNNNNIELTNYENGHIKIRNNNIDSLYIDYNGVIGINTTSPKSNVNLDVNGNIIGSSYYSSNNNSGYWLNNNNTNFVALTNTSNNDFGILTSSTLNSISNSNIQLFVIANSLSNNVKLYYNNSSQLETQSNGIKINNGLNVLGTGLFSNISVSSNINLSGKLSINKVNSPVSFYINSNDAMRIPCGTTLQRPINSETGFIRYNNDISGYEGYTNGSWTSLGGTQDIDGNTYISAEDYPGANNNQLKFYTNSNLGMILDSNQNVGIGTIQPLVKLHIKSTDGIIIPTGTTIQRPNGNTGTLRYNTTTSQFEGYGTNNWGSLGGVIDVGQNTYISAENYPGANNNELKFYTSNIQRLIINKNGDINVSSNLFVAGITTFNSNMIVNGNFSVGGTINYINSEEILVQDKIIQLGSTTTGTSNLNGAGLIIGSNNEISLIYNDFTSSIISNKSITVSGTTTSTNIVSTGNLGIGTTNPISKLQVIGDGNITTNLTVGGTLNIVGVTSLSNNLNVNGTSTFNNVVTNGNVVANGITTLNNSLNVNSSGTFSNNLRVNSQINSQSAYTTIQSINSSNINDNSFGSEYSILLKRNVNINSETGIAFMNTGTDEIVGTPGAAITHERTSTNSYGKIHFRTKSGGSVNDKVLKRMTISEVGNIGIGTDTPSYRLQVIGDTNITTNLTVGGSTTLSSTLIVNSNIGIGTLNPLVTVDINGTDAMRIPIGTTTQRPIGTSGLLRYNNTTKQFEGFTSNNWGSLGGVSDVGQNTYINAETIPGANNNQLKFYTSNQLRMTIDSNGDTIIASNLKINNISSHIIPASNLTYDLGSSNNRFRDLYLSGQTIYLGTTMIKTDSTTGNVAFVDVINSNVNRTLLTSTLQTNQLNFSISNNITGTISMDSNYSLSLVTSNIQRLSVNSNGNIGIGTTVPSTTFQVLGDISSSTTRMPRIIIGRNSNTNIFTTNVFSSNNNNIFYANGNVGIGTTLPIYNLDIKGITHINSNLIIENGNIGIGTINPTSQLHIIGNANITSNINIGGTLSLSGVTSGNIGIGIINPSERIHIYGSNQVIRIESILSSNINSRLDFYNSSNLNGLIGYSNSQDLLLNNSASNGSIRLYTSNTERLTLNNNGNVGIGNNTPNAKLEVNHNSSSQALLITNGENGTIFTDRSQIAFGFSGGNTYKHFIHTRHNVSAIDNSIDFYVCNGPANNTISSGSIHTMSLNSGNVGIGTTSPQSSLHVYGQRNNIPSTAGVHIGYSGTNTSYGLEICGSTASTGNALIDFTTVNTDYFGRISYDFSANLMSFSTSASERIRLNSTGLVLGPTQAQQLTFANGSAYDVPGSTLGTKINLYPSTMGSTSTSDYSLGVSSGTLWYNVPSTYKHSFTFGGTESVNIQSTGLTVNGAIYNASRPFCLLRDTNSPNGTSYTYTTSSVINNNGGMYNSSYPTRVYFPVNGYYTVTFTGHAAPLAATTNMTLNALISFTSYFGQAGTLIMGTSVQSNGGNGDQIVYGRWSGYQPAGAYCTFSATCSQSVTFNFGGGTNNVSACLEHYL
jgi:hypothetical protein